MKPADLQLYFIMGSADAPSGNALAVLEAALIGGITCFQFREKGPAALEGQEKTAFAASCLRLCRMYGVPFIVNDDVELALSLGADGVHVGQDDCEAGAVRQTIGPDRILGVSVHSAREAAAAIAAGADYVGMGPVFATRSKPDARAVAGTSVIRETARTFPDLPIVGIGGITAGRIGEVLSAGACGAAIISAIAAARDPEQEAAAFLAAIRQRDEVRMP